MKLIKGTEDRKVVTSQFEYLTTHKVDEYLVQENPNFTEADRTYACLYQNHVSQIALDSALSKEEREAKKHETEMRLRQLSAWRSDVRLIGKITTFKFTHCSVKYTGMAGTITSTSKPKQSCPSL